MTRAAASSVLAALGVLALGGCGTLANLYSPEEVAPEKACRVFGGTRLDLEQTADLYKDHPGDTSGPVSKTAQALVGTCVFAADMPLSLAADAATLPFTLGAALSSNESAAVDSPKPTAVAAPGSQSTSR